MTETEKDIKIASEAASEMDQILKVFPELFYKALIMSVKNRESDTVQLEDVRFAVDILIARMQEMGDKLARSKATPKES